jgi:hypothetical protein
MSEDPAPTGEEGAESGAAKKRRTFFFRLFSTLALWALVIAAAVFSQEWIYFVIVEAIVLVSVWEFFRMANLPRMGWRVPMVIVLSGIYLGCLFWREALPQAFWGWGALDGAAFVVLLFGLFLSEMTRAPESPDTLRRVSLSLFGFTWLVFFVWVCGEDHGCGWGGGDLPGDLFIGGDEVHGHGGVFDGVDDREAQVHAAHQSEEDVGRDYGGAGICGGGELRDGGDVWEAFAGVWRGGDGLGGLGIGGDGGDW